MTLGRRIMLSMLLLVGLSGMSATLVGSHLLWQNLAREAENRVCQDLNAAHEFYRQRLSAVQASLQYTGLGERFLQAVAQKEIPYLAPRLTAVRKAAALDMLSVIDPAGRVICRADRPDAAGDSVAADRLVKEVLEKKEPISGTILMPAADLEREDPALARKARIRLLATPKAEPTDATELTTGMVACSAVPVFGDDGALIGVLRAGILLNRNYDLVDQVQNTVFRNEQYKGKPVGNATVFLHDTRVSTNVLSEDGSRAIGTAVSEEVKGHVLGGGKDWLGPSWVVNDWYVAAYSPIHDIDDKPIGMLFVGVLRSKFRDAALGTVATFTLVTMAGMALAGLVAWKLMGRISKSFRALVRASEAIAQGNFSETLPVLPAERGGADEIEALKRVFNSMAASLKERDELLKRQTQLHLTRSERLASVGRLAAGIAHEINNPLTGVLTFSHLLLKSAPDGSRQKEDVQTIIEATTRCRDIIRGLLNFSRQSEPHKRLSSLNDVLAGALHLTRNQAHLNRIEIAQDLGEDLPPLVVDPNQIQEVAVNTILNAIDAMHDGGTLTVRTRAVRQPGDQAARAVEFEVADTGCGISPENLEKIFDPFFTTKPAGKGTGLGLAISYGIVTEHGGTISVASRTGRGTSVKVLLPVAEKESVHEEEGSRPRGG